MSWLTHLLHHQSDVETTPDPESSSDLAAVADPPAATGPAVQSNAELPKVELRAADVWQEGQIVFEDFEVIRQLGQGALGPVYIVLNASIGRRYAVKRIRCEDADAQSEFMTALRDWMYLPEHPHLVACRFTRPVGDDVAVFIDCVEGATLAQLIADRRLYEGNAARALERIVDIAIQSAWGLDAIHEMQVAHQDVKPRNVCVLTSGAVKVTDTGLTRAAALGAHASVSALSVPRIGVVRYRPPEQGAGKGVAYAEDIWAWGASLLEAFAACLKLDEKGNGPPEGTTNLELLEMVQQASAMQPPCPAMPAAFAAVLRRCFEPDAGQRWPRLGQAAEVLHEVHRSLTKKPYPRQTPATLHRGSLLAIAHARWLPCGGAQWSRPGEWLSKTAASSKPAEAAQPRGSRRHQAEADMAGYVKAQKAFEALLAAGRTDLRHSYAILCFEKAFLHVSLDDLPSALEHFDKTIQVLSEVVNKEGREELANDLAMAYLNRAVALKHVQRLGDAVAMYGKAIEIWERLVSREGRQELTGNLAWAKALLGEALFQWSAQAQDTANELQKRADEAKAAADAQREARKTETDANKAAELNKKAQEQMDAAMSFSMKAGEAAALFRERRRNAQEEGRQALMMLKAEVKRTTRDDLKALLHWAQEVFESLL